MSRFAARMMRAKRKSASGDSLRTITHGDQLAVSDVGPWALQGVIKGSETLQSLTGPGRGYWRFDTPDEFLPNTPWPSTAHDANPSVLNNPSLHGGIVMGSPVAIDGYSVPVGTRIVQFTDFPEGFSFYAQSTSLKVLFRGCRFRWLNGIGGPGLFNDAYSTTAQQIMIHFCDIGLTTPDPPDGSDAIMYLKFIGGANHRVLRNYHTISPTFIQPNAPNVHIVENYIDNFHFGYGTAGWEGIPDNPNAGHLNGISIEGGINGLQIVRNRIVAPSPDGATGSSGYLIGQIGYDTQPGQPGYGNGTNPGRLLPATDCIALFTNAGLNTNILVTDNLIGGTGYCFYGSDGGAQATTNNVFTGNKVTTRWWNTGGSYGPYTGSIVFGTNGNVSSNNTWADDYGTGGNGCTALADRQYPLGNGPRAGTTAF